MSKKNKGLIFLGGLFVLSFALRFWQIGDYPPLLWDEAALGYNAYSILGTARDEHGQLLPLIFKSFGDYKPGLYVYLIIPFIKLLGLSELTVRLPAVILGSLAPVLLWLLVNKLFSRPRLAAFSALSLALMPWQIHFSRGAWESGVMVFFLLLGSWLFTVKFKEKLKKEISFGWVLLPFLLALWTYQGAKLIVPLILFGLIWLNFAQAKLWLGRCRPLSREFIFTGLVLVLIGFWYWQSFSGPAGNRLKVMSLFSYPRPESEVAQILAEDGQDKIGGHFTVFHGEWLYFLRSFSGRYFNHFSPRFLAFEGDWSNPRHSAPYAGMMTQVMFVLFVLGLFAFVGKKQNKPGSLFLYWLFIAPIPAALTRDIVSGVRALPMVVPLAFFTGWGIEEIVSFKLGKKWAKALLIIATSALFVASFAYWLDLYFSHMVKRSPREWLYGYKEVMAYVNAGEDQVKQVLVSDFYGQPYIFYLFYSRYPPKKYQTQASFTAGQSNDVGAVAKIDNIQFRSLNWGDRKSFANTLFIYSLDEVIRSEVNKKEEIRSKLIPLGGKEAIFYGYRSK